MSLLGAYRRFIMLVDWTLTRIYVRRFEVVGLDHVPVDGPLILASNHLNNADPPMIALAIPRHPTFMAKQAMIRWPILGPAFRIFGAFPVRRGQVDRAAMRAAVGVLERGDMLVMFPEGSRSRTGSLTRAHSGTAHIALRSGAPILPVAITGTEVIRWPWLFLKPYTVPHVKVTIGEPFLLPPVENLTAQATSDATSVIMHRIAALLPPEYRGVYADGANPEREAPTQTKDYTVG